MSNAVNAQKKRKRQLTANLKRDTLSHFLPLLFCFRFLDDTHPVLTALCAKQPCKWFKFNPLNSAETKDVLVVLWLVENSLNPYIFFFYLV